MDAESIETRAEPRESEAPTQDPVGEWRAVPVFDIDSDEEAGTITLRWPALCWSAETEEPETRTAMKEEPEIPGERLGDLSGVDE